MVKILRFLPLGMLTFMPDAAHSQTTPLTVGDIAITGVNATANTVNGATSNKEFCFILLKNINSGTSISFTDFGWRSDAQAFQTALPCGSNSGAVTDGIVTWTATSNMTYGTQVLIRCQFAPTASAGSITAMQATYNSAGTATPSYVQMSTLGESLIAYTGSFSSPNLITGIKCASQGWETSLVNCDYNSTPSVRPAALTGNSAFVIPMVQLTGNVRLKPSVTIPSNPATALSVIADATNWDMGSTPYVLPPANAVVPLPLTLIQFTGKSDRGHSTLNWSVGSETGVNRYVIERSDDTRSWLAIGEVKAKNQSGSFYEYVDFSALQTNYYRLRMEDIDGATTYSNVVTTRLTSETRNSVVYPTRFTDHINIATEEENGSSVTITDPFGRVVFRSKISGKLTSLNVAGLASGLYLLRIGRETFKILK